MPKKTTIVKKAVTNKVVKKAPAKKVVEKKTSAKKVVKKAVSKNPPVKKVTAKKTKSSTKKSLVYANGDQSFWVNDGRILDSLVALNEALNEMEEAVYEHHVSSDKHDFADWVDSVLCDKKCATDLKKASTPQKACTVVAKHLKSYNI